MLKFLSKYPEYKILAYLGIIALSWHLFTVASGLISWTADIFLLIFFSWTLALIIEPVVLYLEKKKVPKVIAAIIVYLIIATITIFGLIALVPNLVEQLQKLSVIIPTLLPNYTISDRIETFLANSLGNSVIIATQIASAITSALLVFILSFYFLLSRKQISKFLLKIIPDEFEDDFLFLENTLNHTFASFIRIQVVLGIIMGLATFIVLIILGVDYALTTSVFSGLLAAVPVIGPLVFLLPAGLAALTISTEKAIITIVVLLLVAQLIYNFLGPKLLGKALQIHPIVVILSFVIGYKIAGFWGAILSVPIASSIAIITKEFLKYWQEEADN